LFADLDRAVLVDRAFDEDGPLRVTLVREQEGKMLPSSDGVEGDRLNPLVLVVDDELLIGAEVGDVRELAVAHDGVEGIAVLLDVGERRDRVGLGGLAALSDRRSAELQWSELID